MTHGFNRDPIMCEGCIADEHWRCGLQAWCECECDGSLDWGMFDPAVEAEDLPTKGVNHLDSDECCHFQD